MSKNNIFYKITYVYSKDVQGHPGRETLSKSIPLPAFRSAFSGVPGGPRARSSVIKKKSINKVSRRNFAELWFNMDFTNKLVTEEFELISEAT